MPPDAADPDRVDPDVVAIDRALVRIRRRPARRTPGRAAGQENRRAVDLEFVPVIDAVEAGQEQHPDDVTVGFVAGVLGVDPSRGSRLVTGAIAAGYLRRVASQTDGRRSCLELTVFGREVLDDVRGFRQSRYERVLEGWSERDRHQFARLITRFVDALDEPGSTVTPTAPSRTTRSSGRRPSP